MRFINTYCDLKRSATVYYSPAKQEYYVSYDANGRIDEKHLTEEEAVDAANDYIQPKTVDMGEVQARKPNLTLDDGDSNYE